MKEERKLIQIKYPPFDRTVKTYNHIYKFEDEMTNQDYINLKKEISKNKKWNK